VAKSFFASRRQMSFAAAFIITFNSFSLSLQWSTPLTTELLARRKPFPRYHSLRASEFADAETSSLQVSNRLDPLLTSFLLRSVRSTDESAYQEINSDGRHSHFTFLDATNAMVGLQVWESSLRKARLPLIDDFAKAQTWPDEPLFSQVYVILSEMGMSRLVRRHPKILTSVLLALAKVVIEFIKLQRTGKLVIPDDATDHEEYDYESEYLDDTSDFEYAPLSTEELAELANSVANGLKQEWNAVVQGVAQLDKIFGFDHELLDLQGGEGFGLQDGIWRHSGWKPMPDLQRRISSMPELRDLLAQLGRRPSAEGRDNRRFKPRKRSYSSDDMSGVELDQLDPTSVTGLTRSGSLTYMLPSEAILLRSSIRSLRWLFLAKFAESKLL
jgi:hypothetical protein